jgi:hypothetical protein
MLFPDLTRAFAGLFTERRSRAAVLVLLLTMAAIPVAELGVIRTFSHLIIAGPAEFQTDRGAVITSTAVFFVGFGVTRGLHHLARFWRVRVFRKGFESSGLQRTHGQASWEWAQGFELSTISVGLIQVLTFGVLFVWINPVIGAVNAALCAGALIAISRLYNRQFAKQFRFANEGAKPGSTAVSERIATRIFAAEFGSVIATASMALMMLVVVWRTLTRHLSGADGVVLFLGLRLLYGHLGALAPSVMRFARDSVRRNAARAQAAATALDVAEESLDVVDGDEGAEGAEGLQRTPAPTSRRRTQLMTHIVMAGQRGETAMVRELCARLVRSGALTAKETNATHIANSFAAYASNGEPGPPLNLIWWPRPFPGNFGDWLSPFVLQRATGHRVQFQPPTANTDAPNLVLIGSIGRFIQPRSVVVGTGVSRGHTEVNPDAQFVSVRGPLTAEIVRRSGGPVVESFGDPGLLLARLLPIERTGTNGRVALVRHHTHAGLPVTLPDTMDEHSVLVSNPADISALVATLCEYDGVVTSAMHVMIACHSYGIPCALVTFRGFDGAAHGNGFKYEDYSMGAGLQDLWEPEAVGLDLGLINWADRLRVEIVPGAKLDEIEAAIARSVKEYHVAVEDYAAEDADPDDDDAV